MLSTPGSLVNKNCNEWAAYQEPGSGKEAALCNGGWYGSEKFEPCPSRVSCRAATAQVARQRAMTTYTPPPGTVFPGPAQPMMPGGARPVQPTQLGPRPPTMPQAVAYGPRPPMQVNPQAQAISPYYPVHPYAVHPTYDYGYFQPVHPHVGVPVPVPQEQYHYGQPMENGPGPVFLPVEGEGVFQRLARNVMQAVLGESARQVYEYSRRTVWFKHQKPTRQIRRLRVIQNSEQKPPES